eukprot:TRINITY_DN7117_c0_g1_i2.p1 TRINITY_DN7117_c0_g1~~TRINITY_DN7117_c0_g1_i2.p1  ORF type:complete len:333 (+),score=62.81 TRINITY_DN7117_c0_g1_i2:62-1060(+)
MWFTKRDVRRQLAALGYFDIPDDVLEQFTEDLVDLALQEEGGSRPTLPSDLSRPYSHEKPSERVNRLRSTSSPLVSPLATQLSPRTDHRREHSLPLTSASASMHPSSRQRKRTEQTHKPLSARNAPLSPATQLPSGNGELASPLTAEAAEVKSQMAYVERLFDQLDEMQQHMAQPSWQAEDDVPREQSLTNAMADLGLEEQSLPSDDDQYDEYDELSYGRGHPLPRVPPVEASLEAARHTAVIPARQKQALRKTDVVRRGELYREAWQYRQVPGEAQHRKLRWHTRQQVRHGKDVPYKPPSKPATRTDYVVPTTKKRADLRWAVRMHLNELR